MEVLGISGTLRGKLISAGYTSLSSLSSLSPSRLATDLNISECEAAEILKACASHHTSTNPILQVAETAWDMLHHHPLSNITTSCSDLDHILDGGIPSKQLTEMGGIPGIGKTQFGIQLSLNVQLPLHLGGLAGKAVFVDTEGSFMVDRALQMAQACIQDINNHTHFPHKHAPTVTHNFTPHSFLANIFYFRICTYTDQVAIINHLDKFISEHTDVKIVVIDSVTFYFRQHFEDMALRTRILGGMALKLMKLAHKFNLAVVLLNQAATKCSEGSYQLTLALGDSWSHACTNRIILYWNGDERYAHLDKSPSLPSASAPYSITSKGIRNSSTNCKRIKLM